MRFVVVYQREPHAGQMAFKDVRQPETYEERRALAKKAKEELEIGLPLWIDTMEDLSRALFGDLPSPAILIGPDGVIRAKLPWAEPERVEPLLKKEWPKADDDAYHAARRKGDAEGAAKAARKNWSDDPARLAAALASLERWDELVTLSEKHGPAAQLAWARARARK